MQLTVSSDWASTRHFRGSHCLTHCSGAPSEGLARCILHLSNPPCSRTRIGRQWAADTDRLPLARTQFHTLFLGSLFHGKQMDRRKERRSGRHTTARTREMERKRGEESKSSRKRDTKRKKAHAPAQEEGRAPCAPAQEEGRTFAGFLCCKVTRAEATTIKMHPFHRNTKIWYQIAVKRLIRYSIYRRSELPGIFDRSTEDNYSIHPGWI